MSLNIAEAGAVIDFRHEKALRAKMAMAADELVGDARDFIQSHRNLLRDLTNAQLYGLLNIVRNISNTKELREKHAQHQARKAAEAGRSIEAFWRSWDEKLLALQEKARDIAKSINPTWVNDNQRIESIAQTLRIKYVQHLIAEKFSQQR